MATETDRPHRKSARELRETGWKMAKAGKAREGIKYLRQARALDDQEAKRVEAAKAKADVAAKATRRDNKVTRTELDRIGTNDEGESILPTDKRMYRKDM